MLAPSYAVWEEDFIKFLAAQAIIEGPTSLADQTSKVSPAMSPVICPLQ